MVLPGSFIINLNLGGNFMETININSCLFVRLTWEIISLVGTWIVLWLIFHFFYKKRGKVEEKNEKN
jgi:hypothetical protein